MYTKRDQCEMMDEDQVGPVIFNQWMPSTPEFF